MSRTRPLQIDCPVCQASLEVEALDSINADRHPELREGVLEGSLQATKCACGANVRLAPTLSYLDVKRGQWIVVRPLEELGAWAAQEEAARALHAQAFGPSAAAAAQELGQGLTARLVFGWDALREKVLLRQLELDDVTVECLKLLAMKQEQLVPEAGQEMRLLAGDEQHLRLALLDGRTGQVATGLEAKRELYDEVASEPGWAKLREQLSAGLWVDGQRLYLD